MELPPEVLTILPNVRLAYPDLDRFLEMGLVPTLDPQFELAKILEVQFDTPEEASTWIRETARQEDDFQSSYWGRLLLWTLDPQRLPIVVLADSTGILRCILDEKDRMGMAHLFGLTHVPVLLLTGEFNCTDCPEY